MAQDPASEDRGLDGALRAAFGGEEGSEDLVGRTVSHYRVARKLGAGGMGEVYLAEDLTLHRRVALKAIRLDRQLSDEARARFRREARLLSQLDHPYICRIFDYLSAQGADFLVLELVEGRTLGEAMEGGLEPARQLRVAEEITAALVAAHGAGVVHRDLKPGNVMLTAAGTAKVLDFGLARAEGDGEERGGSVSSPADDSGFATDPGLDHSRSLRTQEGSVLGTLRYMSPEQARGEVVTAASDVYSLGLILQELFTGRRAYPPELEAMELWRAAKEARTLPCEGGDRDLRRLVERMKAAAPAERPTSAEVLARLRWVRAKPRRRARNLAVLAGVLLVIAGVAKYVLDLGAERDDAVAARDEAARRRDQAEGLIGFMLGDLRAGLEPIGRLDVLQDAGDRALAYFDALPEELLSAEERAARVEAFLQLGQVRQSAGDGAGALELFERARDQAQRAFDADTTSARWCKLRGDARYYVGSVAWDRGDLDEAERHFRSYLASCEDLRALAPDDPETRFEQLNARTNLAAFTLWGRADPRAAVAQFAEIAQEWRDMLVEHPDDPRWPDELGDALSWLGTAHEHAGDAQAALATQAEVLDLRLELLDAAPDDARRRQELVEAWSHLGAAHERAGEPEAALEHFERAVDEARALVGHDAENARWKGELARNLARVGQALETLGEVGAALGAYAESRELLEALVAGDPANDPLREQLELVTARVAALAGR